MSEVPPETRKRVKIQTRPTKPKVTDWISAIAASVIMCATVVNVTISRLAFKQISRQTRNTELALRNTTRSVDQQARNYAATVRPYVYIDRWETNLSGHELTINKILKNVGSVPAHDVQARMVLSRVDDRAFAFPDTTAAVPTSIYPDHEMPSRFHLRPTVADLAAFPYMKVQVDYYGPDQAHYIYQTIVLVTHPERASQGLLEYVNIYTDEQTIAFTVEP